MLFYGETTWAKKNNASLFDVTMGSYDGAEICELVGLFILKEISDKFGKENVGLYRDDGLILFHGKSGRLADKARKTLHTIFHDLGLKITAEVNNHIVNFLDITLNLQEETFFPYRKPNNDPLYVDSRSNHPPSIIKHIPEAINKRISTLSSDQTSFNLSAPFYQNALRRSNYNTTLQYSADENCDDTPSSKTRRRKRKIIWFNPPFSKNVKTNIARNFLQLIDKHFPRTSRLYKIFNRNSVKVSYSCMSNIKSVISNRNQHLLGKKNEPEKKETCNCHVKDKCPLDSKCLSTSIVYKAEISTSDGKETKEYIGMTAGTFKKRYANHKKSLNVPRYSAETELSKYAWKLKKSGKQYNIKWSILKRARAYTAGAARCNLCLEEKVCLLEADKKRILNKRSELFAKCCHRNSFSARKFERTRDASANR